MSNRKFHGYRLLVVVALVAAVGFGIMLARTGAIGDEPRATQVNPTTLRYAEQLSEAFHNAADIALPSIVTVHSKGKAQPVSHGVQENPFKGTPLEDYFKDRGGFDFFKQMPTPRREGMGSGVIIDSSGIVLTNNHVVEGADEVVVHLSDGREFKADEIKTDPQTDLAVIRIHGAGSLPAATMGNSDLMRIGDWVIAIGSPFDLPETVSAGIISGRGRELSSVTRAKFLQTDAAINPGNSGGPLVNLRGEVVGINTAIATNSGSFNGIGFAIPINLAKWVTHQLIEQGAVKRAYLGVSISELTPDLAEALKAPNTKGVAVTQVHPDTPASAAGLHEGDVIVSFADHPVTSPRELQETVERATTGTKHEMDIVRDGKMMTLSVTPQALPEEQLARFSPNTFENRSPSEPSAYKVDDVGIEVTDLTAEQAKALNVTSGGVLITEVDPNKPGYDARLRPGMVILKVGQTAVDNVEAFKAAMKDQSVKNKILFYVQMRPGQNAFVVVKD